MNSIELQCAYTADRLARDHYLRETGAHNHLFFDRWTMSALVYGGLHIDDCSAELASYRQWLLKINESVMRPDFYIVLQVSPSVAFERINARPGHKEIFERKEIFGRIARSYQWIVEWFPAVVRVVDADQDADKVLSDVQAVIAQESKFDPACDTVPAP
jgi:thymidylate kinase